MIDLLALVRIALLAWGVTIHPDIHIEFYENDNGQLAEVGCVGNSCLIGVNRQEFERSSPELQQSIILHEVGHTLGLGHYGSCNANLSIMGCATLGHVTEYDRVMLFVTQHPERRVFVPMVED